jgi:hypothetical protein
MSIRTRLKHLEELHRITRPPEPELSKAESWLEILQLVEPFMQEHAADRLDRHRQAIALLAEYVASGRVNAYVEYFCGGCLGDAAAWRHGLPHGGRLAFLEEEHLARLQEVQQIGAWQEMAVAPGQGSRSEP